MKCDRFKQLPIGQAAAKIGATLWAALLLSACGHTQSPKVRTIGASVIQVGADRTGEYLPLLNGKRVAVVTNQTGRIGNAHLVDSLLTLKVNIVKVFGPEHGFRGEAPDGEHVKNEVDERSGLPLISLYGSNKKPESEQVKDVDVLLFDIQDVGVRFYTFISTLHLVMEAAAENGKEVIVLDRPNPNGFYVDGPVLDLAYASFVGMHSIPLVHGLTIGELAGMINGEGWLKGGVQCNLTVVPCQGYDHATLYSLPVRPSPNLPNDAAVLLYPSLGLFEGTIVSVGRGTEFPFQCIGYPGCPIGEFEFTPHSTSASKTPPHKDLLFTGFDLREYGRIQARLDRRIELDWLIEMFVKAPDKAFFFTPYFDKLAGTAELKKQIIAGADELAIRTSWENGLKAFLPIRAKYLLYPDFDH